MDSDSTNDEAMSAHGNDDLGSGQREKDKPRSRWWLSTPLWMATTIVAAIVGFAVNTYAPRVVEVARDEPALRVTVGHDAYATGPGWTMATSGKFDPSGGPRGTQGCTEAGRFARGRGAVDVESSNIQVVLEGRRSGTFVIRNMRAEVLSRRPPLSGALVFCPSAGAGQALSVGFNLDQPNPVALRIDNEGELGPPRFGRPYFKDGYLTLAKGEVAVLEVYARTSRCDCRWRIVIDALVDGRQQVLPVEPPEGAFETTAGASRYESRWVYAWADAQPQFRPAKPDDG